MAKIATIVYDFASSVTGWSAFIWTGAADQRAQLVATNTYPTATLSGVHDAVDSSIQARVWPAGNGASGYSNTLLRLRLDSANYTAIIIGGGAIRLAVRNAGTDTSTGEISYDPSQHAWIRIAETGNNTFTASTSPDGVAWTVIGSLPHSWNASAVTVAFQAGRTTAVADSNLYVDDINVTPPPAGTPVRIRSASGWDPRSMHRRSAGGTWTHTGVQRPIQAGRLLFDAKFETTPAVASSYPDLNPEHVVEGEDFGLTSDPDTTKNRTVAWFDSWARKATSNGFPRSSVCTAPIIKGAYHGNTQDEYWYAVSVYLPETHKLTADGQWLSHNTQAFGPPYNGSSPCHMSIQPRYLGGTFTGENIAQFNGRTSALGTGPGAVVPFNTWRFYIVHLKMAYAPNGWVEIFQHIDGAPDSTWQRVPIDGITDGPAPIAPLAAGVNDAWVNDPAQDACYTSIGVYGTEPRRLYYAHHRVGTSKAAIDDPANGWWVAPLPDVA